MGGCVGKDSRQDTDNHAKNHDDQINFPDFEGGNVHVITTKEQWDRKIADASKAKKIVVANFSSTWCKPCHAFAPEYAQISMTYPELMFFTIDVDDLLDLSLTWEIKDTPTFFFLKNGKQIGKHVGANKPEFETKVQALAQDKASVSRKPSLRRKASAREKATAREKLSAGEKSLSTTRERPTAREKTTAREKPSARDRTAVREKRLAAREKPVTRDKSRRS